MFTDRLTRRPGHRKCRKTGTRFAHMETSTRPARSSAPKAAAQRDQPQTHVLLRRTPAARRAGRKLAPSIVGKVTNGDRIHHTIPAATAAFRCRAEGCSPDEARRFRAPPGRSACRQARRRCHRIPRVPARPTNHHQTEVSRCQMFSVVQRLPRPVSRARAAAHHLATEFLPDGQSDLPCRGDTGSTRVYTPTSAGSAGVPPGTPGAGRPAGAAAR